jgi:hypothetical protein
MQVDAIFRPIAGEHPDNDGYWSCLRNDVSMTRRWMVWGTAATGMCALITFLAGIGLDRADKVASVIGMFVGLSGLALSIYTVVQNRATRDVREHPPGQPTATGVGLLAADERRVADQAAARDPTENNQLVPGPSSTKRAHSAEHESLLESVTLTDVPREGATRSGAAARTSNRPNQAGAANLCVERRTDSGRLTAVDRVSDRLALAHTPEDPTFEYAADAACTLCGAVYRMGIKKKELVPRPGPANWAAAVICGILTVAMSSFLLWLIPPVVHLGFVEAPADGLAQEIFTKTFVLTCAVGAVMIVVTLGRWTRDQLRMDATHIQLLTGPQYPGHAHIGRIFDRRK